MPRRKTRSKRRKRRSNPKLSKKARAYISRVISRERRVHHRPQKQAIAIAYSKARKRGYKVPKRK